ncbi:capsule assembly Wzi family protein [Persicitalea jodogahamensis]|uniref:Capsule assembly protein Wzi n=1 Tax=Persicitalea jodogahamensis TaxID=402147 RepID=A0A8J3D222_9BACT|nr:capsule assembly Wzi family protein [Persicitalea jodogahamensis]GHB59299.1 hypothetical protein GCM10007390_11200 [Persicitalea jodogahamensis]
MRYLLIGIFGLLFYGVSNAQDSTLSYHARIETALSTAQTPFWLHANQFGTIPVQGSFVAGQVGLSKLSARPGNKQKFFTYSAGIELAAYAGPQSAVFLTDAYVAGWIGPVEVSAGQRKEIVGLVDTTLTSGSFAISGNSRPYPRVQLSIPRFLSLGFTGNFVAFKGSYSDGLLGSSAVKSANTDDVPYTFLHHKSLYVRLGKPAHNVHIYGGFNHQAMWGGDELIYSGGLTDKMAYEYVVLGKSWANSRVGNHFGTIDLGAEWRARDWTFFAYRQNIYEDGSLAKLTNVTDGLNGLRINHYALYYPERLQIRTFLLEFINTKSQGGNIFDITSKNFGRDNYYNHYVYKQGWSYRGRSLGSPAVPSQDLLRPDLPRNDSLFTTDNRILMVNAGITGRFQEFRFLARASISRHFGTYDYIIEPPRTQFSMLMQAEKSIPFANTSIVSLKLATDLGGLYPNSFALMLGWRKEGIL